MRASESERATQAAIASAASLGLTTDDTAVLHNSDKLTLRLQPCDVVARVAPTARQCAQFEVDVVQRLTELDGPVAELTTPEVFVRDDYTVTLWTYYEPMTTHAPDFARALERLHAGMREVDLPTPHFTDRVSEALALVSDRAATPALIDADRDFLAGTLDRVGRAVSESGRPEQLLHGEPHPGNLLSTRTGPRFIDFETCCRGPIEFDLAHAPAEVADHYPDVDHHLLQDCRTLVLAMITAWRWDRADQFPDGPRLAVEWLADLRKSV